MNREVVASIRTRAELARRLARELKEPAAARSLLEIADSLDADAAKLEEESAAAHRARREEPE